MSHDDQVVVVMIDFELQDISNYFITTKKYKIVHTTLIRRFTSKTVSNYKVNTESQYTLNFAPKEYYQIIFSN